MPDTAQPRATSLDEKSASCAVSCLWIRYGKTRLGRQRQRCKLCGRTRSIGPAVGSNASKRERVYALLAAGMGVREAARSAGVHRDTVMRTRDSAELPLAKESQLPTASSCQRCQSTDLPLVQFTGRAWEVLCKSCRLSVQAEIAGSSCVDCGLYSTPGAKRCRACALRIWKSRSSKSRKCPDCGCAKSSSARRCRQCSERVVAQVTWPYCDRAVTLDGDEILAWVNARLPRALSGTARSDIGQELVLEWLAGTLTEGNFEERFKLAKTRFFRDNVTFGLSLDFSSEMGRRQAEELMASGAERSTLLRRSSLDSSYIAGEYLNEVRFSGPEEPGERESADDEWIPREFRHRYWERDQARPSDDRAQRFVDHLRTDFAVHRSDTYRRRVVTRAAGFSLDVTDKIFER